MVYETKLMCGIILITVPSIEFGGYFLLSVLGGKFKHYEFTPFQKTMFRAGHAHAGVLVILSLICEVLVDFSSLDVLLKWMVRSGMPLSALLISGGFFLSALGKGAMKPSKLIVLIFIGAFLLALSLIILGIGLIRE